MRSLFFFLCLIVLLSCQKEQRMPDWILGTWLHNEQDNAYERWEFENDTLYLAKSFSQPKDMDTTIVHEMIRLELRGNELFYIPRVFNQNDGRAIEFRQIPDEKGRLVFENKNHDFPQRIIYEKEPYDGLKVSIEGPGADHTLKRSEWRMDKIED